MKYIQLFGWILFAAGLILKPFHLPGNAVLMMAGVALLLILHLFALFIRKEGFGRTTDFTFIVGLAAMIAVMKFFPFRGIVLDIGIFLGLITLYLNRKSFRQAAWCFTPLIAALLMFFIPKSVLYHTLNIQFSLEKKTDFRSYDKYAWFLYNEGKDREAIEAVRAALKMEVTPEEREVLLDHEMRIQDGNWLQFREDRNGHAKQQHH